MTDWAAFKRTLRQTQNARRLRDDATAPERILWSRLKQRQLGGFKFRRQHPVGRYVLDFYCPEVRLCVEIDGDQHGRGDAPRRDAARTAFLNSKGIEAIRFWNHEIRENLLAVLESILHRAGERKQEAQCDGPVPSLWKGEG